MKCGNMIRMMVARNSHRLFRTSTMRLIGSIPTACCTIRTTTRINTHPNTICRRLVGMTTTTSMEYQSIVPRKHYFSTTTTTTTTTDDDTKITVVDDDNDDDSTTATLSMKRLYRQYQLLQYITHSTRSLGVWEGIESLPISSSPSNTPAAGQTTTVWESICQLPEIETVIHCLQQIQSLLDSSATTTTTTTSTTMAQCHLAITALERAIQIFGSYRPGGMEQMATYGLLVEFQNRTQQYDNCHTTLHDMLEVYEKNSHNDNSVDNNMTQLNDIVQAAKAKVYWYQGQHEAGKEICDVLVYEDDRRVCVVARTGQALTRLSMVSTLDDVFSIRDPFRIAIRRLERMVHPSSTALAVAYLNMGVAEMAFAETVSKFNNVDAPLDAAMRNWNLGITTLSSGELMSQRDTYSLSQSRRRALNKKDPVRAIVHARLWANMAYGMLHLNHHADYITRSLEYASKSLAIYDNMYKRKENDKSSTDPPIYVDKEGLGRTLSLLGTVYHLQGNAVLAQGLFQSALDKVPIKFVTSSSSTPDAAAAAATPLQLIEQSDSYERYADLCNDWEQREGDAKQLRQKGQDINSLMLPDGWKDKTSIHGSLWFLTEAIILRH